MHTTNKFDVILLERPCFLNTSDLLKLADYAHIFMPKDILPLDIQATEVESCAMGFISNHMAYDMDYIYEPLEDFIANILNDMDNESENNVYTYTINNKTYKILLTRNMDCFNTKPFKIDITFEELSHHIIQLWVPQDVTPLLIQKTLSAYNTMLFDTGVYDKEGTTPDVLLSHICADHPWIYHTINTDFEWNDSCNY